MEESVLKINLHMNFLQKSIYVTRKTELFDISWVYNSYNTSLISAIPTQTGNFSDSTQQTCIPDKVFIQPFDPRCRGWYKTALKEKGKNLNISVFYNNIRLNILQTVCFLDWEYYRNDGLEPNR